jgi:hypothetical protein
MGQALVKWDPANPDNPFACIDVLIVNSQVFLDEHGDLGFEFRKPVNMKALIDTGAGPILISTVYARHAKLFQTRAGCEISVMGGSIQGGEYAGSVSFPGTTLRSYDPIRIVSGNFHMEHRFSCLIGIDIIRHWKITFDAQSKLVTIDD